MSIFTSIKERNRKRQRWLIERYNGYRGLKYRKWIKQQKNYDKKKRMKKKELISDIVFMSIVIFIGVVFYLLTFIL